jgi:D-alanine-D-alanine ligase
VSSNLAVVFGGPSPEHDISILTGLQAVHALSGAGHQVTAVYWEKSGGFVEVPTDLEPAAFTDAAKVSRGSTLRLVAGEGFVAPGKLGRPGRALDARVVVVCCHGGPGEDGSLQGALELAGLSYTGPSAAGAALGMDKASFGAMAAAAGLPSLPRHVVDGRPAPEPGFSGPYILKPRFGGSSIGIEVVADWESAVALSGSSPHLRAGAIVEPWRENAVDIQLSVRSYPERQLSPIEKPLRQSDGRSSILDYRDKYVGGEGMASAPRELPAQLPADVEKTVRDSATVISGLVGLRGVARIDFLWDEAAGQVFVNEINTIPGSLSKYLWEVAEPAVPFARLLDDLVAEAEERPTAHWTTEGADGTALRSAGTIASKLG